MAVADRSIDPRILEAPEQSSWQAALKKRPLKTICEGPESPQERCISATRERRSCSVRWWNRRCRTYTKWPMPGDKDPRPCPTRN